MTTTTSEAKARSAGLRLAAKLAGISGVALAVMTVVDGPVAMASSSPEAAGKLPFEEHVLVRGGGCGCSPCWGPPAPPAARRGCS
jgi:hypothetical protein